MRWVLATVNQDLAMWRARQLVDNGLAREKLLCWTDCVCSTSECFITGVPIDGSNTSGVEAVKFNSGIP